MHSAVHASPVGRGACRRTLYAAVTTCPRNATSMTCRSNPIANMPTFPRSRALTTTITTTTTMRARPCRRPTRWCAVSASDGDDEDTAVTVGDSSFTRETHPVDIKIAVDNSAASVYTPLISVPSPALSSDGKSGTSAGASDGGTSGKENTMTKMKAACKGCGGTGATSCTSCGGSGTLAAGGFHSKNHVDVKNIVGTNWTAHRRTRGWRHFEAIGKSPADKGNGNHEAMIHLAATCDRDITVWVSF